MLKGLPSAYDKDLQEDKTAVFEAFDSLSCMLPVMAGLIKSITVNKHNIAKVWIQACCDGCADYLVKKGVPFRQAHETVGKIIKYAKLSQITIKNIPITVFKLIDHLFEPDVLEVLDFENSVNLRDVIGGTSMKRLKSKWRRSKRIYLPTHN